MMKLFLKILLIVTWIALAAGAVVLMSFANKSHNLQRCLGVTVNLDFNDGDQLITPEIIKSQLLKEFGKFENKLLGDISIEKTNEFLKENQYIERCDVHLTVEGRLVVNIKQCNPVFRVLTPAGQSYYVDDRGKIMTADPHFPVRVMIASGFIGTGNNPQGKFIKSLTVGKKKIAPEIINLANAYKVATAVSNDSIMKALTEQIHISDEGIITLLTKTGTHTVTIGDAANLEEKFAKLETFYMSAMPKVGWERYKSINLAYQNQVICTK
jgi:cell division protein FtsQ